VGHVRGVMGRFQQRLRQCAEHSLGGEARGVGLVGALELVRDKATKAPFDLYTRESKRGLSLYVKGVYIMDECRELMPEYLRFVRGLVDSPDLPLNVSREMVQQDRLIQSMRKVLAKKWLSHLEDNLKKGREAADRAADWMREMLQLFGTEAKVKSRMVGENVQVAVLSSDASLLIGREGKNIQAFQLLLRRFVERNFGERDVRLDVESPDRMEDRGRGRDRDDDRGRGRDRDDDRGRGRDRDDRDGDRGGRGERQAREPREGDAERDEAIRVEAREAAEQVLAGDAEAITLSDMNSYERHVAHSAIKVIEGVSSRSVGDRRDKLVEVFAD
ncbi:MAG TPA: hypothetical protein EYQ02_01440, partial [Microbacterium sp.]|nr:hypothetical protein [Microbacterium sp.]